MIGNRRASLHKNKYYSDRQADYSIKDIIYGKHEDNSDEISKLKRLLRCVIEEELTGLQKEYIKLYYFEKYPQKLIAEKFSVSIQSVSAAIQRGRKKIYRILKYYIYVIK